MQRKSTDSSGIGASWQKAINHFSLSANQKRAADWSNYTRRNATIALTFFNAPLLDNHARLLPDAHSADQRIYVSACLRVHMSTYCS